VSNNWCLQCVKNSLLAYCEWGFLLYTFSMKNFEKFPIEKGIDIYSIFVPFSITINAVAAKLTELREQFDKELKIRGINLSPK
jgi:hypothetical protein